MGLSHQSAVLRRRGQWLRAVGGVTRNGTRRLIGGGESADNDLTLLAVAAVAVAAVLARVTLRGSTHSHSEFLNHAVHISCQGLLTTS